MGLTLGQAAQTTGKSKAALSKAISGGRLSAVKKENGSFDIDPAELDRWVNNVARKRQPKQKNQTDGNIELTIENKELKAKLEAIEKETITLKSYVDDLKSDKEFLQGELKKATMLLTHHKKQGSQLTLWQWLGTGKKSN